MANATGSEPAEVVNSKHWDHDTAFEPIRGQTMADKAVLRRDDISEFITNLYEGDLHAKRVLSLANATLGCSPAPRWRFMRLVRVSPKRWAS